MLGFNQEELNGILNRIFARHLLPFEVRDVIWKFLNLDQCSGCNLLYPPESLHGCEIFGSSSCPRCIPSHFCVSLKVLFDERAVERMLQSILLVDFDIDLPLMDFKSDASNIVVIGFSKSQVNSIREALEEMRDDDLGMGLYSMFFGLRVMSFEYLEGVFE
jgi:hypothetical protein